MAEDKNGNPVPLDLDRLRKMTHALALELPESVFKEYGPMVIEAIQMLEAERKTRITLCHDVVRLKEEVESWKNRAAKHGCNVEDGDPDCG
jgi:hypothetical protein